ncbi:hypothetical protein L249_2079 [Ophiocordyceps polyrhachis-furcata BCC 54312]|uniref:DNA polymerase alpha subunit B n=1 Tax=Ophiocordyceps polyrhachis-furcata BCC 54312 TaxID=1330021 RepID=A0A367LNS8_9HYPO|nr:hypothetical protein L249_2079 [Ophiocordyceps polyrhachis-furcata BCC 54312]
MADEETELAARFAPGGKLEADVAAELTSIMRLYELSVQDTLFKWESFCLRRNLDANDVSLPAVRDLKGSIHDELERERSKSLAKAGKKAVEPGSMRAGAAAAAASVMNLLGDVMPVTPRARAKSKLDSSPATGGEHSTSSSFGDRAKSGEVIEVLNGHLPAAKATTTTTYHETRIKLTAASDQTKMGYKPLAMKLSETSEVLDDRIDDWAELVRDHHGLDESEFGNAAAQGTTEMVAVGRIASDAVTDEGRLNAASLVLETSRRTGMGFRVPLNLDSVSRWSFFPGQVVALRGSNASGTDFVVREVLEAPLLPGAASAAAALDACRERLRGGRRDEGEGKEPAPLNVIFASGPYTADDNLDFEPLHALCSRAADGLVDAIVLAGPFIDVDHPLIASGDFDLPDDVGIDPDTATMTTVFRYLFAPALNRLASSRPQLTMMLVPSVRDVLAKHVSWPQDAFPRKELGLPRTARILSNPMTLSINEMLLAVSTQDILYQLRGQEVVAKGAAAAAQGDVMARLCRYLIEQRHYFPLFPPTDRQRLPRTGTEDGVATGSVLDLGYIKLGEMVNVRPDVMLVPSALPPFVKVVESVVAINPGHLSKRKGAGTYAHMTLYSPEASNGVEADAIVGHGIFDRARVEIVRI